MYAYVSSYLVLLSLCFLYLFLETKKSDTISIKVFFFIGLIPSIIFAVFRGNVGTDTATYFQMAQDIGMDSMVEHQNFDIEIGFYLILKLLNSVFSNPRVVINLITLFIAVYAFYLFSKTREQFLTFSLLIFPLFFFDMTMNGLRYGLSFLVAKHASDKYAANKKFSSLVLLVACVGFQLSGILVFLLLRVRNFKFPAFSLPLVIVFYAIFEERLAYKFIAYTQLASPDLLSGLLPLGVFFACYLSILLLDSKFVKKFMILLALEIASFILAKFTYAGLRFQLLILFVLFCYISEIDLNQFGQNKIFVIFLLFFVGLIGFAGTLKHYVDDANIPPSPFLPYRFFLEEE